MFGLRTFLGDRLHTFRSTSTHYMQPILPQIYGLTFCATCQKESAFLAFRSCFRCLFVNVSQCTWKTWARSVCGRDAYPEALRVFGVLVAGVVLGIVLCVMRQRSRRKLRLKLIRGEDAKGDLSQVSTTSHVYHENIHIKLLVELTGQLPVRWSQLIKLGAAQLNTQHTQHTHTHTHTQILQVTRQN